MKKLWESSPQLILSGLGLGLQPPIVPLWADGREVVFANGAVKTVPANDEIFDFDEEPLDAAQSFTLGRKRLYLATTGGVYRYVGPQTEYEVPALLATQDPAGFFQQILTLPMTRCTLLPWGDWIISSDGLAPVKIDANTGTMGNLAGTPFAYARVIGKYQAHMFAADTDLSGRRVYWSAIDDPETWTPSLDNDAGSNPCRDLDSRIRAFADIGPNMAVYSQDQMIAVRYIGGNNVFYFAPALRGIGAVSSRSIISINRYNWGLTKRGIFQTDGVEHYYVDEPLIRKWLRENINWSLSTLIQGYHDESAQEVCWCVPLTSGDFVTISYGYISKAFTLKHAGARFGREADVFDDVILGFSRSVTLTHTGTTPASYVETKPLDCGSREIEKLFQMFTFDATWTGAVSVSFAYGANPFDTFTYEDTQDLATEVYVPGGNRSANFVKFKIEAAAGASFELSGFQIHGEAAGFHK